MDTIVNEGFQTLRFRELLISTLLFGILPQPLPELRGFKSIIPEEPVDESPRFPGCGGDFIAVKPEKRIGSCEPYALVSVNERMIYGQTLPKRGRLGYHVIVISALRPVQRRVERTGIPESVSTAETLYQDIVHRKDLDSREINRHFASFL